MTNGHDGEGGGCEVGGSEGGSGEARCGGGGWWAAAGSEGDENGNRPW